MSVVYVVIRDTVSGTVGSVCVCVRLYVEQLAVCVCEVVCGTVGSVCVRLCVVGEGGSHCPSTTLTAWLSSHPLVKVLCCL